MRRIILASHAYLAKGLSSAVELIVGKQENLSIYSCYVDDVDFTKEIEKEIKENLNNEYVILTDLFGGSVNNELLKFTSFPNVHLITGTNLILLISILLCSDESLDVAIPRLVEESKQGIVYCNAMNKNNDSEDSLDDF